MGRDTHDDDGNHLVPPTKVLAIASHVVYGYVGNTMATFCMQTLGCEVAALNTVHFSNHTGYRQFRGSRTPASEIKSLYHGLRQSHLLDFDVLLSGYIPSAEVLHEVATIARDLRYRNAIHPGGFFWVLDPVMGDQGKLYVSEEMVQGYKSVIREADLVLPNQFELELISGVTLTSSSGSQSEKGGGDGGGGEKETEAESLERVADAIETLHVREGVKHVAVTSVRVKGKDGILYVVGSSARRKPRPADEKTGDEDKADKRRSGFSRCFVITIQVLNCFFSGTGDMFAGLMVARLREACSPTLLTTASWMSDDNVSSTDLPLAKAAEKVLKSMHAVLMKTKQARDEEMKKWSRTSGGKTSGVSTPRTLPGGTATSLSSTIDSKGKKGKEEAKTDKKKNDKEVVEGDESTLDAQREALEAGKDEKQIRDDAAREERAQQQDEEAGEGNDASLDKQREAAEIENASGTESESGRKDEGEEGEGKVTAKPNTDEQQGEEEEEEEKKSDEKAGADTDETKRRYLTMTKAAEVRAVRNADDLRYPEKIKNFGAEVKGNRYRAVALEDVI